MSRPLQLQTIHSECPSLRPILRAFESIANLAFKNTLITRTRFPRGTPPPTSTSIDNFLERLRTDPTFRMAVVRDPNLPFTTTTSFDEDAENKSSEPDPEARGEIIAMAMYNVYATEAAVQQWLDKPPEPMRELDENVNEEACREFKEKIRARRREWSLGEGRNGYVRKSTLFRFCL
ncbi:MAG: hypothetical protein Q9160_002177 [Pyrenula sp. 1 TL-2023]